MANKDLFGVALEGKFKDRFNIIARMPFASAYTYLLRIYSTDNGHLDTNELLYTAHYSHAVPLAVINNNKLRSAAFLRRITSSFPQLLSYDNISALSQLAHTIRIKTTITQSKNTLDAQFSYPKLIRQLSTEVGFDLLNDHKVYPFCCSTSVVKCNVFLRDVVIDLLSDKCNIAAGLLCTIVSKSYSISHNQLCACLLYICNIEKNNALSDCAYHLAVIVNALLDPSTREQVIELSNALKVLGAPRDPVLILLCEIKTLLGKQTHTQAFMEADLAKRCDPNYTGYYITSSNTQKLKNVLKRIYSESVIDFDITTTDDYWMQRWARCKSGAHKIRDEQRCLGEVTTLNDQPTRRNFIEGQGKNILFTTEPMTLISPSCKNENGKNRVIYSCDTINYLNFDYFIQHIEDNWLNPNIILKPSSYTDHKHHMSMLSEEAHLYFSLDYDDFNSQHSLTAMKAVVEVFSASFPEHVRSWLLNSFDNMELSTNGKKWYGTLPSGHRLTTFINSVLNYAYLELEAGISRYRTFHTGDDCIIKLRSIHDAEEIVSKLGIGTNARLRLNKQKQIVGVMGEFLRHAYWHDERGGNVRGYYTRAIASLVNGSWTSSNRLDPDEYVNALSEILHTIRARSHTRGIYGLNTTIMRRVKLSYEDAYSYLQAALSINRSPIPPHGPNAFCCDLIVSSKNIFKKSTKSHASRDYLAYLERRRPILFKKISRYKHIILNRMAEMSLLDKREVEEVRLKFYKLNPTIISKVDIADLNLTYRMDGYLSNVMPFPIIKKLMKNYEVVAIVKQLGKEIKEYERDIWGHRSNTVFYSSWLSYKDLKVIGHSLSMIVDVSSRDIVY